MPHSTSVSQRKRTPALVSTFKTHDRKSKSDAHVGHSYQLSQVANLAFKGDLQTIFRFSYLKVHKLITMGMKFKNV